VEHGDPDNEERARDLYAAFVTDHPDASEETITAFIDSHPSEAAVLRRLVGLRRSLTDLFAVALPDPDFVGAPGETAREPTPALSTHSIRKGFVIGDFTLVRHLGRGGMGEVWEAQQATLNRSVALKLLARDRMDPRSIEYFAREARAAARLAHPGIVPVFGAGVDCGAHWIAMELVPGGATLADFIENVRGQSEISPDYYKQVTELVVKVADALHAAHEEGVIHRDLKPHNVLITPDDQPRVADFGLAHLEGEHPVSRTGDFVGTLYYMSPEQVLARRMGIDHRTDIFSLGVVLYELLTLRRPFEGDSIPQLVQKIAMDDPPDPRTLRSRVPLDLAVIAGKALEKKPDARYASMAELAQDLRRYLAHEPVLARAPSLTRRAGKWIRRHPAKSAVGVVSMLAFLITAALLHQNLQTNRELRAERDQARAVSEFLQVDFISAVEPSAQAGRGRDVLLRTVIDRSAEQLGDHFDGQPLVEARIRDMLGRAYQALGELEPATTHLERALALRREHLSDEHPDTLSSIGNLGVLWGARRRDEQAESLLREALEGLRHLHADEHSDTLLALHRLGSFLIRRHAAEAADPYLREALEGRARTLGPDARETLATAFELAFALWQQGQMDEAEQRFRGTLETCRRVLGSEDRQTVAVIVKLASFLGDRASRNPEHAQGFLETEELLEEALESNRRVLGDTHAATLETIQLLGMTRMMQGDLDGAARLHSEALDGMRQVLSTSHEATHGSMLRLADLYMRMGREQEAQALAREFVELVPEPGGRLPLHQRLLNSILQDEGEAGDTSATEQEQP
jgi:serine/threonine protein kinase